MLEPLRDAGRPRRGRRHGRPASRPRGWTAEIDPNPAKPADFGLEPPEAVVRSRSRAPPRRSSSGWAARTRPGSGSTRARATSRRWSTMSESVARDTARPVADFRDRSVIAFDRRNVTGLDLDVAGDQIGLGRRRAGQVAHREAAPAPRRRRHGRRVPREAGRRQGARVRGRRAEVARALRARQAVPRHGLARPATRTARPGPCCSGARCRRRRASTSSATASRACS